jgi:hypothetical protein
LGARSETAKDLTARINGNEKGKKLALKSDELDYIVALPG